MEGAWNEDEDEGKVKEAEVEEVEEQELVEEEKSAESKSQRPENLGHGGGDSLPSPPASEQSATHRGSSDLVSTRAVDLDSAVAPKTKPTNLGSKLRGATTMLDEEDVGSMPKEEIKESWIKIALGLREDLSVK